MYLKKKKIQVRKINTSGNWQTSDIWIADTNPGRDKNKKSHNKIEVLPPQLWEYRMQNLFKSTLHRSSSLSSYGA